MQAGSPHHKKHCNARLSLGSPTQSYFTVMLLHCSGWYFSLQSQTLPCSSLDKAVCHPPPSAHPDPYSSISLSRIQGSSLVSDPSWSCRARETVQEISTLSWLSMNDFKEAHRSYLQEISWKCTACVGKLVPVFYPVKLAGSPYSRANSSPHLQKPPTLGLQDGHFQLPELHRGRDNTSPIGQRGVYSKVHSNHHCFS